MSGSTTRARDAIVRAGMWASAATASSAAAQATNTGHARSGVETATIVIPSSPISFARGSRRWIGLSPTTPTWRWVPLMRAPGGAARP